MASRSPIALLERPWATSSSTERSRADNDASRSASFGSDSIPQTTCGSMGEAGLIITIGLGLGLTIAATALLRLSHVLTGSIRPHVPLGQHAAILGCSALLALALPTRRALRSRPGRGDRGG